MIGAMTKEFIFDEFKKLETNAQKVDYLKELKKIKIETPKVISMKISVKQIDRLITEWSKPVPFDKMLSEIREREESSWGEEKLVNSLARDFNDSREKNNTVSLLTLSFLLAGSRDALTSLLVALQNKVKAFLWSRGGSLASYSGKATISPSGPGAPPALSSLASSSCFFLEELLLFRSSSFLSRSSLALRRRRIVSTSRRSK